MELRDAAVVHVVVCEVTLLGAEGDVVRVVPPPDDVRRRVAQRLARQRHVVALAHHQIRVVVLVHHARRY
jgi:hypothetical protein